MIQVLIFFLSSMRFSPNILPKWTETLFVNYSTNIKKQKEFKHGIIISCTGINIQTIRLHEIEKNVETKKKKQNKSSAKINK